MNSCIDGRCQRDISKEEAFVRAYWDFKRRLRTDEPTAHEFGIPWSLSEVLARQVQKEFEHQLFRKLKEAA